MQRSTINTVAIGGTLLVVIAIIAGLALQSGDDTVADHLSDGGYFKVYDDDPDRIASFAHGWCETATEQEQADGFEGAVDALARPMSLLAAANDPSGRWPSTRLVSEAVDFLCPEHSDAADAAVNRTT